MNRKTSLWRGLSAVMAFMLILSFFGGKVANANAGGINNYLGISGPIIYPESTASGFTSDYGELSDESLEKLITDEMEHCIAQLEEGTVLLMNNGVLPLDSSVKNVTLFGHDSAVTRYRNSNGGGQPDPQREITFKKAFNDAGFTINDTLYDAYKASNTTYVKSGNETEETGEEPAGFYTDALKSTFAQHSDAAIVVLYRAGGESTDMSKSNVNGISSLALQPNERDMLQMINDSGVFDKIIILINSVYPLELGWLEEFNVDACLWIGNPGYYGLPGVINILTGAANPSGRLVDTYAANSLSSAAAQNFGEYRFENGTSLPSYSNRYVVYQEGIYVGYKYYETRYEDTILGQGNADGAAGVFNSTDGWNYAEEICYPFGYGLSYTSFEQTLDSCDYDETSDTFRAVVTVKNTGNTSGKSVVELYVQSPYTDYDKEHGVEKASIQLVGFGKTRELAPGASETLNIEVKRYLFASYDITAHEGKGGYIFDAGDYYFAIGDNAHDALNNVLAAKGAEGMFDQNGNPVPGNAANTVKYTLDTLDDQSYQTSPYTGNEVHNLFADVDANYYYEDTPVTYLSRNDWENTWSDGIILVNNEKMTQALVTANYAVSSSTTPVEDVPYNIEGGLTLYDMIGATYDDPRWETLIQQMSLNDLGTLVSENYGQAAIESIGKPPTVTSEGAEGISQKYKYGTQSFATGYAANTLIAATWNRDLQAEYGNFVGEDGLFTGVQTYHGLGADTHRAPFCGRSSEYMSEDSVISFYVGMTINEAISGKGLINNYKHFFLNDQEYDRQGIATFANEQSLREIYLRAYEGGLARDGALGIMTSYNRVGTTYEAANSAVQISLLRNEWGYKGYTMTDYVAEGDYSVTADTMINGTNIYGGNNRAKSLAQLISRNKDGDMLKAAQESAHHILWSYVNSSMINTMTPAAVYVEFVAWWQYVIMGLQGLFAVLTFGSVLFYMKNAYLRKKSQ